MNFAGTPMTTPELMVASLLLPWATRGTPSLWRGIFLRNQLLSPPWNFLRCGLIIPFLSHSQEHGGPQELGRCGL